MVGAFDSFFIPDINRRIDDKERRTRQLLNILNQTLDPAETEAISLAVELGADRSLINGHLGRSIAASHGLKHRGLLDILVMLNNRDLSLLFS